MCCRDGNKKRNFVLVNKVQGKHYPCSPKLIEAAVNQLVRKADVCSEHVVLIAFAETATALGCMAAEILAKENDVFLITTTREEVYGSIVSFEEEHSHATNQQLAIDSLRVATRSCSRIILLDDEVSTGKTNLNVIEKLEAIGITAGKRVEVWSYVNSMNQDEVAVYEEKGIRLVFLLKLDRKNLKCEADEVMPYTYVQKPCAKQTNVTYDSMSFYYGGVAYGVPAEAFCRELREQVDSLEFPDFESVDVVGVEECMYPAVCIAERLETEGVVVTCHSTTRSPICANEGSCLHERYKVHSVHERGRTNYIYNLGISPNVILVVDGTDKELTEELVSDLSKHSGIENIHVISLTK